MNIYELEIVVMIWDAWDVFERSKEGGKSPLEQLGSCWTGLPRALSPPPTAAPFSSYSSPLGLCFSLTATTTATCGRGGLVAAFTGPLRAAGSRAAPRGAQVALPLALYTAGLGYHRREVEDASTGRSRARVAHWLGTSVFIARRGARGWWSPCM
ncbi:hypothetical protein ACOSQ4_021046 [Xanthoceras sorbifolium]